MDHADCIMCVSELTRRTVIDHYGQDPAKVVAMHNAVYPLPDDIREIVAQRRPASERKEKVVTFLGRITMQKGPEYFVEAAALVLKRTRNIRFCFAGSGDMMEAMIELAARRGIADRFHFPGFMKGREVYEIFRDSDVYVMPSVSEPFGISPLEAMQCGVPSIISYQRVRRDPQLCRQGRLLGYRRYGRCHLRTHHLSRDAPLPQGRGASGSQQHYLGGSWT